MQELSAPPNSHLAVPFQQIPWGSWAEGPPQTSDPEPQGPRWVLSETEKLALVSSGGVNWGLLLPLLCAPLSLLGSPCLSFSPPEG